MATAIATSDYETCAVLVDGSVRCWGAAPTNTGPTLRPRTLPVLMPGIVDATSVSVSLDHDCALVRNGSIRCWGANESGQLGDGTQTDSDAPVTVAGITNGQKVTVARSALTCALLAGDGLRCWGDSGFGQLGDDAPSWETDGKLIPTAVPGVAQAFDVATGYFFACAALPLSGSVECWGANDEGQLGTGEITYDGSIDHAVPVYGLHDVVRVSAGVTAACALSADGTVRCWGRNHQGQLGNGTTSDRDVPVSVVGLPGAVAVAVGDASACAITTGGAVLCWGYNGFGQLGDGTTTNSSTPVVVVGVSDAVAVSVHAHACALLITGSVQCWGDNEQGQLGNGSTTNSSVPVTVPGF